MKFSQLLVATFGFLSLASARDRRWNNGTVTNSTVWTTEVVTAYTTYCPHPTTVVANNHTYTVTSATTLTIENCPCTISKIVSASHTTAAHSSPSATVVGTGGFKTTTVGSAGSKATTAGVASSKTTTTSVAGSKTTTAGVASSKTSTAGVAGSETTTAGVAGSKTTTTGIVGSKTGSPAVFTGGAVALGSSFCVLVLGGVAAVLL